MSHRHNNGPGPIPNRWLKCPMRSDSFICDRFVAFKTPLDPKFDDQVPDEFSFYPYMLINLMKDFYKKKLGLWIDLTNTTRFYNRVDIEKKDCKYVKLQCRGFGETPSREQVHAFIELVDEFNTNHPLEIIGVHCTHGFNRTGFLICSYLVEKYDFDIAAAIQTFADSRPPGIYKQDYINELFKRYGDEDDEPLKAPDLPEWCYDEPETDDHYNPDNEDVPAYNNHSQNNSRKRKHEERKSDEGESQSTLSGEEDTEESSTSTGRTRKRRRENIRLDAVFMAGVPGVVLLTDKKVVNDLQHKIQDMCEWKGSGFPGCQPVSMDRQNIRLLHTKPYLVSWKADGTRYMMLINDRDEIYFFDRDNSCFQVEGFTFLKRDLQTHLKNTLLDGEMVIDKFQGQNTPRYLIYDIVTYDGENVGRKSFKERIFYIQTKIIEPRIEAMKNQIIKRELEPFSVRIKEFWDVTYARNFLSEKFAKQLTHEPDGLIFQPKMEPYVCGRCDDVLKWKPSEQNSVDFKLKIQEETGMGMLPKKQAFLYVGNHDQPFSKMPFKNALKELDNKIIECKYDGKNWVFMRVRTDKSYPNAYSTAVAVCKSIQEPVTKESLLMFIDRHRFKDDSELMGPPRKK